MGPTSDAEGPPSKFPFIILLEQDCLEDWNRIPGVTTALAEEDPSSYAYIMALLKFRAPVGDEHSELRLPQHRFVQRTSESSEHSGYNCLISDRSSSLVVT